MRSIRGFTAILVASFTSAPVLAQDPESKAVVGSDGVRRDPDGVQGISPFWEAIQQGDNSYVAGDHDNAMTHYRDAITKQPRHAMGHYRMAEAHIAKGDWSAATEALESANRYADNDAIKAKILFVQADLHERQKNYDPAIEKWTAYETFSKAKPEVKTYPETPTDRKHMIEAWKERVKLYKVVEERIAKRAEELAKTSKP